MGGFFGVASKEDCIFDLFFGTDYHSHLGTRRAGMAVFDREDGFAKAIHKIENSPFRTKFDKEANSMHGCYGIGSISDFEPQPIMVHSHHGTFAVTTVGKINNVDQLEEEILRHNSHFFVMSNGNINPTELVAALINQKENFIDGIRYALEVIDGSLSLLVLTERGIYAGRDRLGRTPICIGKKDGAYCAAFESCSFANLGYQPVRELAPGEIVVLTENAMLPLYTSENAKMKICTFLWVYYGYPSSTYEGISVEKMRYRNGAALAKRDHIKPDIVVGVPDSGTAHAIGYSNAAEIPFSRPLIKYTPTWPRSFMPTMQQNRDLIAKMKLIAVPDLIKGKSMVVIDDSIVRGTQLRDTAAFLFESGATEVHVRPACPPIMFGCKYLNFSRSKSEMELIARRSIVELEGTDEVSDEILKEYCDPESARYEKMVDLICKKLNFTSLRYQCLSDMIEAVGIEPDKLCTYCWNGEE